MAIIVTDNFNRADGPLGNADTGQPWVVIGDDGITFPAATTPKWQIVSSMANDQVGDLPSGTPSFAGYALIDSGLRDCVVQAVIGEVTAGGNLNSRNWGINWCFSNILNWYEVAWAKAFNQWRVTASIAGSLFYEFITGPIPVNGDVLRIEVCGSTVQAFLNGVLFIDNPATVGSYFGILTGTMQGFSTHGGVVTPTLPNARFDDFLITTNGTCTPTYNCTVDGCVDPGDGSGTYGTLAACLEACAIPETYNCVTGVCVDPGDGTGEFDTLEACQSSGCGTIITDAVETVRFDAGTGSEWYLVPPVSDSSNDLRSKVLKSMRATGRFTNASMKAYGFDVSDNIKASDLEDGLNASTSAQVLSDSTKVKQSQRKQINVPNAVLSTVRLEGDDTGQAERDEVHEICVESAEQGVRR